MILKVIFTILFFFLGIIDKDLSLSMIGNTIYIGVFLYLSVFVISKNKNITTVYGFFYFLGLGSGMSLIGLLPLIMLAVEYLYTLLQKFITTHNKIINFIVTGIYFALNYLFVSFIINNSNIIPSFSIVILVFIFIFIGGIISLFSKPYER